MSSRRIGRIQGILDRATHRWWFFMIVIVLQFLIPSYAAKNFTPAEIGNIIPAVLPHAFINEWELVYPLFKVIPIVLIILIPLLKNRICRIFSIYVAITYLLFAFLQNIAITEKYGLAIVTTNVLMFILVALVWIWEAIAGKNDFTGVKIPLWRYWVVPLAFLSFWYPLNMQSMQPDFNPLLIFTSSAGLAFCLMTPVYIAILTLYYPKVNMVTLRITSLVGVIIAFYNMIVNFVFQADLLWWNGVLHIPLLSISIYGLVLSLKFKR